jgi:hypothetical protein
MRETVGATARVVEMAMETEVEVVMATVEAKGMEAVTVL